jgi:hypothetical protein
MRTPLALLVAAAAMAGCIREGAAPLSGFKGEVSCQRPRTALRYVEPSGKDSLLVAGVESFLAKRPVVFDSLASACQFSAREAGEGWRLTGVFRDGSDGLHLVYFNRYRRDRIMAGRKLHLCFDGARKLTGIFVYEVPLE